MSIIAVAPLAGAWIEIRKQVHKGGNLQSLPSRERGLKYKGKPIRASEKVFNAKSHPQMVAVHALNAISSEYTLIHFIICLTVL